MKKGSLTFVLGGAALCLATAMPAYAAPNASPAEAPQAKQSAASVCTGTVVDVLA